MSTTDEALPPTPRTDAFAARLTAAKVASANVWPQITPGDVNSMVHQTQPTGWSCDHTCLAMIMGVDAQEVIKRTNPKGEPRGLSRMDTIAVMQRFGMIFAPILGSSLWDGWHLAVVPSLNHEGGNHSVLIYHDDQGEFKVIDPAMGKRYDENGRNFISWSETILVKPSGSLNYWDRVMHVPWPDSDGWWWCKSLRDGHKSGDERLVQVKEVCDKDMASQLIKSKFVLMVPDDESEDELWYRDSVWVKAESPWRV